MRRSATGCWGRTLGQREGALHPRAPPRARAPPPPPAPVPQASKLEDVGANSYNRNELEMFI